MPRGGRNDWRTPEEVLELVRQVFGGSIPLDPCASPDPSHHFAAQNMTGGVGEFDGLLSDWTAPAFCNPPFDKLDAWAAKCAQENLWRKAEVILLLPARTDTKRWHDVIRPNASAVCFWRGRLTFVGAAASAPFACALVYFGPRPLAFGAVFEAHGQVVLLGRA